MISSHTLMQAKSRQAAITFRRKAGEAGHYQDPEYDVSDDDSS